MANERIVPTNTNHLARIGLYRSHCDSAIDPHASQVQCGEHKHVNIDIIVE